VSRFPIDRAYGVGVTAGVRPGLGVVRGV